MTVNKQDQPKINQFIQFQPSTNQAAVLNQLQRFLNQNYNNTFVLTGSAGTGKTTVTKVLADYLAASKTNYYLCAPTGRAAKIISEKTQKEAITIHHLLYTVNEIKDKDGNVLQIEFVARTNISKMATVYIVDESSMVPDQQPNGDDSFVSNNSLLCDLIAYVKEGNKDSKIIFIGDKYQLPPVRSAFSPALDPNYLKKEYKLNPISANLSEVFRQKDDSYILTCANIIKKAIDQSVKRLTYSFIDAQNKNIFIQNYISMQEKSPKDSVLLAWRNISINDLNQSIRAIKYNDTTFPIVKNEQLIMAQNSHSSILRNGTFVSVDELIRLEDYQGFKFADVKLREVSTGRALVGIYKIRIDYLINKDSFMKFEDEKRLFALRMKANSAFRESKDKRVDQYLSALKVRYGYAITVHKSQGGEWKNVFLYPEIPFGKDAGR
ncbi:MAG: hypothetical protein B7C24_12760 [Bacteroidetes bacterium 4572_77]|nr:MAG: hypothetical protein B7C24_12760 [Bacteroidetes bacterium 4572_77]